LKRSTRNYGASALNRNTAVNRSRATLSAPQFPNAAAAMCEK
jgi:hypothetical protein